VSLEHAFLYSPRIKSNLNLPNWVNTDEIAIDIDRTLFLMSLGGISSMKIVGKTGMETTESMPIIVGIGQDGSTLGGRISASTKIEKFTNESLLGKRRPFQGFLQNSVWTNLLIQLNLDEISNSIRYDSKSLKKSSSWIPHIDKAVRTSIINSGINHLLRGHDNLRKFGALLVAGDGILLDRFGISIINLFSGDFNFKIPNLQEVAFEIAFTSISWAIAYSMLYGPEKNGSGYRFSLIPGWEADRAILLQILGRVLPLIKDFD